MKDHLRGLLAAAAQSLIDDELRHLPPPADIRIERTRDAAHGDFAANLALTLAKPARRNPRQLAQALVDRLPASELIARVEVAGPGFINFFLTPAALQAIIPQILQAGQGYGRCHAGAGRRALVEFVSANPTGPLHVGHGRGAAYGDSVANLLEATGHDVAREYYVNDAGRQMDILATSVWLRYLELCGETVPFPPNGYQGDYIRHIAEALLSECGERLRRTAGEVLDRLPPPESAGGEREKHLDGLIAAAKRLLGNADYRLVLDRVLDDQLDEIRGDLAAFSVSFDRWFSEREVAHGGALNGALERLREAGYLYQQDGATWFRSSELGDEKDRVVVRDNGDPTYFASDIAYHLNKLERGFDLLIDVWGADHHGYIKRLSGAVEALTGRGDALEVRLVQFVSLYRGHQKLAMSTRAGQYVTLADLRREVGTDAARFFYVSRSNDQHLDFDLDLAKSRSNENPVYYIQYAHARVASVMRQLEEKGRAWQHERALGALSRLTESHEQALLNRLSRYPETVEQAAQARAPHTVAHYLRTLAEDFHSYYNAHTFLVDDEALRDARLALVLATRQVLRNGLELLGVSAPESM